MMLVRLFLRDVLVGMRRVRPHMVAALFLGALFCAGAVGDAAASGISAPSLTFADAVGEAFNFSPPRDFYQILGGRPLSIRFPWFFTFALLFASTLDYPRLDALGAGYREIVDSGSRWLWWLSKCLWVITATVMFFAFFFAGIALASRGFGMDLSLEYSEAGASLLDTNMTLYGTAMTAAPHMALTVPVCSSLVLVQLAISMVLERIPGFALCMAVMFLSTLFDHPALPGNYLVSGRSIGIAMGGVQLNCGLALSLGIAWAAIALGGIAFSRMTIFGGVHDE